MSHREDLQRIHTFPQLIAFLRDEMGWPIESDDLEELTFDYTAEELGIDSNSAASIEGIKRLRPLVDSQPWGIFFVTFEPKRLPVVALRRILSRVVVRKRASANPSDSLTWETDDLLFISAYGQGEEHQLSFVHFSQESEKGLPTLRILEWNRLDTPLRLDSVALALTQRLAWPTDEDDVESWRESWSSAFTLRRRETVTTSRDLSIRLAELARGIREQINDGLSVETEEGPLTRLMEAFRTALVHDLTPDGFADMYAQTIAYGLLSARIANPKSKTTDDLAAHMRTNPLLRELMNTFLEGGSQRFDSDELGVNEVVELLDDANMEEVIRDFGDRNPREDPVIHFYELFLSEYDPKEKLKRGVFYTPRPVVSYIVRSVDELLRSEFGLEDGLADTATWGEMARRHNVSVPECAPLEEDFVQILDPACGTGTFLVEVIDLVHDCLIAKWQAQGNDAKEIEALWNAYVPEHLLPRLHGYELLMAPYAIAHLKIGLKLYETGYRFGSEERAHVYLTNALDPAGGPSGQFDFAIPALAHEARAVGAVKRKQRFTVLIGNPPYSLISANMEPQHRALVERFKYSGSERIHERGALQLEKILNDDYVKFIAKSQDALDASGVGILGVITNHAYLDNPTMRGLRSSLLGSFCTTYFYDLGGSAKKATSDVDENVFDIQQGVCICLAIRGDADSDDRRCHARLMGDREAKYTALSGTSIAGTCWEKISPTPPLLLFAPRDLGRQSEFAEFVPLPEVFPLHSIGCFTSKDHFVISRDPATLVSNAKAFRDSQLDDSALCEVFDINPKRAWNVARSREQLRQLTDDDIEERIRPFIHRPFDAKYMFYDRSLVWSRAYPVNRNLLNGKNLALVTSRQLAAPPWRHAFCTNAIVEMFLMSNRTKEGNHVFPLYISPDEGSLQVAAGFEESRPNLGVGFLKRLATSCDVAQVGEDGLPDGVEPEDIFHYAYGVLHSPTYRTRYVEFLKLDFASLPLPRSQDLFRAIASAGGDLVALHVMKSPSLTSTTVTYVGPRNVNVGRVGWSDETVWLDAAGTKKGQPATPGTTGFHGVPQRVWDFEIGCYQVCEKWLKDRKGRTLSDDDIAHYQKIVVALSETIRIMGEIDDVIEEHGGWPGAFSMGAGDEG